MENLLSLLIYSIKDPPPPFTLSVQEKLKNSILEIPIIPQTLNINT